MVIRTLCGSLGGNMNTLMAESFAGPYAGRVMGIYNMICQLGCKRKIIRWLETSLGF